MELTWTVYILLCSDQHLYVGCTENFKERLKRHVRGHVPATAGRLPVKVIHTSSFPDKYKAFAFEKYLKSGSGRAFAKRHLV